MKGLDAYLTNPPDHSDGFDEYVDGIVNQFSDTFFTKYQAWIEEAEAFNEVCAEHMMQARGTKEAADKVVRSKVLRWWIDVKSTYGEYDKRHWYGLGIDAELDRLEKEHFKVIGFGIVEKST